jgi:hypothetical protein
MRITPNYSKTIHEPYLDVLREFVPTWTNQNISHDGSLLKNPMDSTLKLFTFYQATQSASWTFRVERRTEMLHPCLEIGLDEGVSRDDNNP